MSSKLPVYFIGHGSPMNAIQNNAYTRALASIGAAVSLKPKAILCISAHWMTTKGTWVTRMKKPKTIHDFYGFPKALFDVQYPAPGSPEIADLICKTVTTTEVQADESSWGLDHGTWSILKHMFPLADIPVLQLSIDLAQTAEFHFNIGQELQALRSQGVLIISSGNIVHNLRQIDFNLEAKPFDWAIEFDLWVKNCLKNRDFKKILNDSTQTRAGQLSIPTLDHWIPLLYTLGASSDEDSLRFEYEGIDHGSISMLSFSLS